VNNLKLRTHITKFFSDVFSSAFTANQIKKKYGERYYDDINKSRILMNLNRILPLSIGIFLYQIMVIIIDFYTGFYDNNIKKDSIQLIKLTNDIFLSVVCLFVLIISARIILKKNYVYNHISLLYFIFYFLISYSLHIAIHLEVIRGAPPNSIYYLIGFFAFFPVLTFYESVFFIFHNTWRLFRITTLTGDQNLFNDLHIILLIISGWLIMFYLRSSNYKRLFYQLDLKKLNEKLDTLSKTDPLTNLPNRRYLDEYVRMKMPEWKEKSSKIMVLMADIDNFKNYNDFFSHLDGDDCINAVASSFTKTLHDHEGLESVVARIGGEEFTVLVEGWKTEDEIRLLCDRIRQSVEDMHIVSGEGSLHRYVTVSIGGSIYEASHEREGNDSIESHYRLADYELYNAKKNGKNRVSIGSYTMKG